VSNRIKRADLIRAAQQQEHALKRYGLMDESENLEVEFGSKASGLGYRLYLVKEGRGGYRPPLSPMFLGMTAREAYDAITMRTWTLGEVMILQQEANLRPVLIG